MAINWTFNENDYQENSFAPIPVGDHRVRIKDAEETVSKNTGKDMIKLTLEVSGHSGCIWYYIVFDPTNQQLTNQKLGQVFSSFGINPGDLNLANWIGQVGAARVKHRQYNGETQADVSYFLSKDKQEQLPPWQGGPAGVTGGGAATVAVTDDDLPF